MWESGKKLLNKACLLLFPYRCARTDTSALDDRKPLWCIEKKAMKCLLSLLLMLPALIILLVVIAQTGEYGYKDGIYCAEVKYYYPKTGTRSTYVLKVKIKNNKLMVIYWPNGGWLDDSHFYPPDISDGYAEFVSDRGAIYTVKIVGEGGDCYFPLLIPDRSSSSIVK